MIFIKIWCFIHLLTAVSGLTSCLEGWFGQRCDYMCHCAGQCSPNGQCADGIRCANGWFGPTCQYEDISRKNWINLVSSHNKETRQILDNDEETCADNIKSLDWTSSEPFLFTWIRLVLGSLEYANTIKIDFRSGTSLMSCKQQRLFHVNERTIDIYCTVDTPVEQVSVLFDVAQEVCSIYISGGRNVALKQKTVQSSNWKEFKIVHHSGLAVNGDKNNLLQNGSCSHTNVGDPSPYWSVKLRYPAAVSRYVLYNRNLNGSPSIRLQGFILDSYNADGLKEFRYQDTEKAAQYVYSIVPGCHNRPVSNVTVRATNRQFLLHVEICEVDVLGENECPDGFYGFDCDEPCDCPVKCETSYNRSLGCPLCPEGYQGTMCDEKIVYTDVHCENDRNITCDCPVPETCDCPAPAPCDCPAPVTCGCPSIAPCDCPTPATCHCPSPATCGCPSPAPCDCPAPATCDCPSPATCDCPVTRESVQSPSCDCPVKCEADRKSTCECQQHECETAHNRSFQSPTANYSTLGVKEMSVIDRHSQRTDLVIVICCLSFIILTLAVVNIWQYRRHRRPARRSSEEQEVIFTSDDGQDMKATLIQ